MDGALAGCVLLAAFARAQEESSSRALATLAPGFALAGLRAFNLSTRPGLEIVLLGEQGEVLACGWDGRSASLEPLPGGRFTLADPMHALIALGDRFGGGGKMLVALSSEGTRLHVWNEPAGFDVEGELVAPHARFSLRTGRPTFAPLLSDVDGDGTAELVVPRADACELWRAEERKDESWTLRRAAEVVSRSTHHEEAAVEALSDELEASFVLPGLRLRDVNGDERDDLLVTTEQLHAFHLQREDGSFPPQPDVRLDLTIFRDTTPQSEIAPGEIVSGNEDDARLVSEDLDGDGIVDHVITHRRKVWVFRGEKEGPRFTEPVRVLKASEDVTAALVLDVDADGRGDLVLIKVRVPRIGEIVLGLVSEWEIGAHVVGYQNRGDLELSTTPTWERDLALRLPPLLDVLRSPEKWVEKVEKLGEQMRAPIVADLGGDGVPEIVLPRPAEGRLALWRPRSDEAPPAAEEAGDTDIVRRFLFEDERTRWSIDSLLQMLADRAAARLAVWTRGREPDALVPLRPASEYLWLGVLAGDFDGDGRQELLLAHEERARAGFAVIEILRP